MIAIILRIINQDRTNGCPNLRIRFWIHRATIERPRSASVYDAIASLKNVLIQETAKAEQAKKDLIELKNAIGKPFEHLDKMQQMRSRIREIELLLSTEDQGQVLEHICLSASCADYNCSRG